MISYWGKKGGKGTCFEKKLPFPKKRDILCGGTRKLKRGFAEERVKLDKGVFTVRNVHDRWGQKKTEKEIIE